jgi:hypothetical protein
MLVLKSRAGVSAPASGDEQVRRHARVETRIRAGAGMDGEYVSVTACVRKQEPACADPRRPQNDLPAYALSDRRGPAIAARSAQNHQ